MSSIIFHFFDFFSQLSNFRFSGTFLPILTRKCPPQNGADIKDYSMNWHTQKAA